MVFLRDTCTQHSSFFYNEIPAQNFVEFVLHILHRDVGKKSKPAQIDADHGQAKISECASDMQHGAVPSDHNADINCFWQGLAGRFNPNPGDLAGRGIAEKHSETTALQERLQGQNGFLDFGILVSAKETRGMKCHVVVLLSLSGAPLLAKATGNRCFSASKHCLNPNSHLVGDLR
jgi:hypothetical protein